MRRPLDWIVVSISLMVLAANRMLVPSPSLIVAADPVPRVELVTRTAPLAESPFAYVREDGTLVIVPIQGMADQDSPPRAFGAEDLHADSGFAQPARLEPALFSWSATKTLE